MNIDVKAALILLATLFLGVGLGATGEAALLRVQNDRVQDLRRPPGFVAHIHDVIGPRDSAQAEAIQPYLEQTARQNDSIMRAAQGALRLALDSMRFRLAPLLSADQRDRLDRESAAPPGPFGPGRGGPGGRGARGGFLGPGRGRDGPPPRGDGPGPPRGGRRGGPPPLGGQPGPPPPDEGRRGGGPSLAPDPASSS